MENVIGWLLIAMVPTVIAVGGIYLFRAWKRDAERKEREAIAQAEQRAKEARERERQRLKEREEWQARLDGKTVSSKYDYNTNTIQAKVHDKKTNTTTYSTVPTESLPPVNNWSNDLLTTMVIADLLTNHKDVSAGTVKWKDDTPTVTETYSKPSTSSWGLDDDDSRKSASSTFSSNDSDSSWSSSSSDSGPSSDW